jgi:hypothetical protein
MIQRRRSNGEDNVMRMGGYYTNRVSGQTYSDLIHNRISFTSKDNLFGNKLVTVCLDRPSKNRISRRRGSASSFLAQQTADFLSVYFSISALTKLLIIYYTNENFPITETLECIHKHCHNMMCLLRKGIYWHAMRS